MTICLYHMNNWHINALNNKLLISIISVASYFESSGLFHDTLTIPEIIFSVLYISRKLCIHCLTVTSSLFWKFPAVPPVHRSSSGWRIQFVISVMSHLTESVFHSCFRVTWKNYLAEFIRDTCEAMLIIYFYFIIFILINIIDLYTFLIKMYSKYDSIFSLLEKIFVSTWYIFILLM